MNFRIVSWFCAVVAVTMFGGCKRMPGIAPASNESSPPPVPKVETLEVLFTYSSEKERWVSAVTTDFHQSQPKTASGKLIRVRAAPKSSGELIDGLLSGVDRAHLASPASEAFIKLGNARSRAKSGGELIAESESLVRSPVVIAMGKPMAEALGWPNKSIGWAEVLMLARTPGGWISRGNPQWGTFKFGHTHPGFSNSGLASIYAEVHTATGKIDGITDEDLAKRETAKFIAEVERSVMYYGSSPGFLGRKLSALGPACLSAAVVDENVIIESYAQKEAPAFPIVAIYPREGTFLSDHPAGIVDRDWVTAEHREAAKQYLAFLLDRRQQERALEFGFRPALTEVPLVAPFDAEHGVNPREPQISLELPEVAQIDALVRLWRDNKKRSNVTLVIDVSGGMNEHPRMEKARLGAQDLIRMLADGDEFRLLPFNQRVFRTSPSALLRDSRQRVLSATGSLIPEGGSALYDAVATAFREQFNRRAADAEKFSAIVVLSRGTDTKSTIKFDELLKMFRADNGSRTIRIFTIGYDADGATNVLQQIAGATDGKFYEATPENIREVFKDIGSFF